MSGRIRLKGLTVKARMLWFLLPLVILCILILSLIANQLNKTLLMNDYAIQKEYIVDNVVRSMNLINAGYGMLDTQLEKTMTKDVLIFKSLYDASSETVDLADIKQKMKNAYDLAVINSDTVIIDSTMPEALQFSFKTFDATLGDKINAIRLGKQVAHERIRTNVVNGLLSKFSYVASGDGTVLLEIIYNEGEFAANVDKLDPVKTLKSLEASNPYVSKIKVYDVYGYEYTNSGALSEPTDESITNVKRAVKENKFELQLESQSVVYAYIPDPVMDPLSDQGKVVEVTFDSKTLDLVIKRLALILFAVGTIIALISADLIYWSVKRITTPITQLSQAAKKIAEGNYNVQVLALQDDEIGQLGKVFNAMTIRIHDAYFDIENQLKTTLQSMGDGLISTNEKGEVVIINKEAEALTGWTYADAVGSPIEEVFVIKRDRRVSSKETQLLLINRQKHEIPIDNTVSTIVNQEGIAQGSVIVFRDVTDRNEKMGQIEYLSYHDQLTGLYNRRYFEEALDKYTHSKYLPLSLVMLDINGLKLVNDAFGHQKGDDLLICAAETLEKGMRTEDVLARIDGDEFVIILPNTDGEAANQLMSRLMENVNQTMLGAIQLSVSYGVSTQENMGTNLQDVYKLAEDQMYRRKLHESNQMRHNTIQLIIETLELRDANNHQHTEDVSLICEQIGQVMNFPLERLKDIKTLGALHDIGKIALPVSLYSRREDLTEAERVEMERHPEVGYQILKSVSEYARISDYVLAHHEHYDGKGYPMGKIGEAIPLESRILLAANHYVFLRTEKETSKALSHEETLEALLKLSGHVLDPKVVEALLKIKGYDA